MRYKHKFYLYVKEDNEKIELATCADEMTANLLKKHYSELYSNKDKFKLAYRFRQQTYIL